MTSNRKASPFKFTIGQGPWQDEIRYFTTELTPEYWANFRPVSAQDIVRIEHETQRRLPKDFTEFLQVFGAGFFPEKYGGEISDPEEIVLGCHSHLWMIMGSRKWASPEDQRRFYVTRGRFNPAPKRYTRDALALDDVSLLDLMQIGNNGMSCYHQLYVGEPPGPLGYCLLTPEGTIEDRAQSFSEGLKLILTHHWLWDVSSEDEPRELPPLFGSD